MGIEARAVIKFVRVSPRKVRRVADMVRGRGVNEALTYLKFVPHAAAKPVAKAIKSAAANAEDVHGLSADELYVARITADDGPRLKRWRAGPRGRAKPILKRSAHITVVVSEWE